MQATLPKSRHNGINKFIATHFFVQPNWLTALRALGGLSLFNLFVLISTFIDGATWKVNWNARGTLQSQRQIVQQASGSVETQQIAH